MFPNPQDALPLPPRPDLEQYKKLAKELQRASRTGDEGAIREWALAWVRDLVKLSGIEITPQMPVRVERWARQVTDFAQAKLKDSGKLADAQFVLARAHGFLSWPKFVKHIEGAARKDSPEAQFEAAADAIVSGDMATLKKLLRLNPKLVQQRSAREHNATLLHYVSANGVEGYRQKTPENIVEITELLLKAGADVNAECDVYGGGSTTLGLTATSCHPEAAGVQGPLMQVLLDHGAASDQPRAAGNLQSAVIGCLANGRKQAAEYLAAHGVALDLEAAAGVGRLDVLKSFYDKDGKLKPGASEEQVRDGFMWACEFGRDAVVAFFLDRGVPAHTAGTRRQVTGLHWAAYSGHANIVRMLLDRGAQVNAVEPEFDGTPLGWALYGWGEGHPDGDYYSVVTQLVRAGANVDEQWFNEGPDRAEFAKKIKADARMMAALRKQSAPAADRLPSRASELMRCASEARLEGRHEDALRDYTEAVAAARPSGGRELVRALMGVGQIHRDLQTPEAALPFYEEAIALSREIDDRQLLAHTVRHLADLHRNLKHPELAAPLYEEALAIYRSDEQTRPLNLANTIRGVSLMEEAAGNLAASELLWEEAHDIYIAEKVLTGVAETAARLALLAWQQKLEDRARQWLAKANSAAAEIGDPAATHFVEKANATIGQ